MTDVDGHETSAEKAGKPHAHFDGPQEVVVDPTLEKSYFETQPVNVNPLKLLLGAAFMPGVSMSDQPGPPVTATFERIGAYLKKFDAGSTMMSVLPDK